VLFEFFKIDLCNLQFNPADMIPLGYSIVTPRSSGYFEVCEDTPLLLRSTVLLENKRGENYSLILDMDKIFPLMPSKFSLNENSKISNSKIFRTLVSIESPHQNPMVFLSLNQFFKMLNPSIEDEALINYLIDDPFFLELIKSHLESFFKVSPEKFLRLDNSCYLPSSSE
jgi:hypothetical protein